MTAREWHILGFGSDLSDMLCVCALHNISSILDIFKKLMIWNLQKANDVKRVRLQWHGLQDRQTLIYTVLVGVCLGTHWSNNYK